MHPFAVIGTDVRHERVDPRRASRLRAQLLALASSDALPDPHDTDATVGHFVQRLAGRPAGLLRMHVLPGTVGGATSALHSAFPALALEPPNRAPRLFVAYALAVGDDAALKLALRVHAMRPVIANALAHGATDLLWAVPHGEVRMMQRLFGAELVVGGAALDASATSLCRIDYHTKLRALSERAPWFHVRASDVIGAPR